MSRDNETSRSKKSIDSSILAAIITVVGGICIALIPTLSNMLNPQPTPTPFPPTWTPVPTSTIADTPVPTTTVPVGDPSSTPAPATPTPEPTPTPAPPKIGEDWANGCISAQWIPHPPLQTTENNVCLSEPVNEAFYADKGSLKFLVDKRFENTEQYGMFAPLPSTGIASISVSLRRLQDGEIWIGVFAQPDINSQGMIIVIPPGDVKKRLLVQKTMPGQLEVQHTATFTQNSATYDVVFEFGNGSVVARIMRDTVFNALPVGSTQQWLFVGYQVKRGNNRIDAEFLNFMIQGQ